MSGSQADHSSKPGRWADLLPRTLSAIVMLGFGGASIHFGGLAFAVFVSVCIGAVVWEAAEMAVSSLTSRSTKRPDTTTTMTRMPLPHDDDEGALR